MASSLKDGILNPSQCMTLHKLQEELSGTMPLGAFGSRNATRV